MIPIGICASVIANVSLNEDPETVLSLLDIVVKLVLVVVGPLAVASNDSRMVVVSVWIVVAQLALVLHLQVENGISEQSKQLESMRHSRNGRGSVLLIGGNGETKAFPNNCKSRSIVKRVNAG
jgi:hypothetical protein